MFNRIMPTAFQNIEKSNNITIDIGFGIFDGIPHPRLGSQVNNNVKAIGFKDVFQCRLIPKIKVKLS